MNEQWRPVVGWEGFYEVSDHGRVRSVDRSDVRSDGQVRFYRSHIKAQTPNRDGRLRVALQKSGRRRAYQVHRLVLEAFVEPCPTGMECRHLDGNQINNHVSNLQWGTASENALDRVRHGTHNCTVRTHCPRGHALSAPNLVRSKPREYRACLSCARARAYVHYHQDQRPNLQVIADSYYTSIAKGNAA